MPRDNHCFDVDIRNFGPTPRKGLPQELSRKGLRPRKRQPFPSSIVSCSRAKLSPGLGDQGSDTQDSTWILVQHCVTSTITQNPPAWPRSLQCLPTISASSNVCRVPACGRQLLLPTRRRDRSLREPRRRDFQRNPLTSVLLSPRRPALPARLVELVVHARLRHLPPYLTATVFAVLSSRVRTSAFSILDRLV